MEIGSEFWLQDTLIKNNSNIQLFDIGKEQQFLFSGRTAIDYVLQDILLKKKVKNVYFPSYYCDSMIEPFIKRNINVIFYDVYFDVSLKYNINIDTQCDIFFAMNYFGYEQTNMEEYISNFKQKGTIIIEDITHSLLSKKKYCKESDYLIASLRKWFPILSGGIAINMNNNFSDIKLKNIPSKFTIMKQNAMQLKKEYINDNCIDKSKKEKFLEYYKEANDLLKKEYQNYKIDEKSYNILTNLKIEEIIRKRQENAKMIYKKIKKAKKVIPMFEIYSEGDCPLFVPVIIKEKRDMLKKFLIGNDIYCPVHWSKPIAMKQNDIYETELSLICDQRYNKEQICKYIDIMIKYLKEN